MGIKEYIAERRQIARERKTAKSIIAKKARAEGFRERERQSLMLAKERERISAQRRLKAIKERRDLSYYLKKIQKKPRRTYKRRSYKRYYRRPRKRSYHKKRSYRRYYRRPRRKRSYRKYYYRRPYKKGYYRRYSSRRYYRRRR